MVEGGAVCDPATCTYCKDAIKRARAQGYSEAVQACAALLQSSAAELGGFTEPAEPVEPHTSVPPDISSESPVPAEETSSNADDPKTVSIRALDLSTATHNVLISGGLHTVGAVLELTHKQLGKIPGLGPKGLRELEGKLTSIGYAMRRT